MSNTNNHKKKSAQVIDAGLGELNKVRDILFGREINQMDSRFEDLERATDTKLDNLNQKIQNQLSDLNKVIDNRFDSLSKDLSKESSQRDSQIASTKQSLDASISGAQKLLIETINSAEDAAQQDVLELRNHVSKQQKHMDKEFSENLDTLRSELIKTFDKQISEMQGGKLSREALALMLDEMTVRLRKERD